MFSRAALVSGGILVAAVPYGAVVAKVKQPSVMHCCREHLASYPVTGFVRY